MNDLSSLPSQFLVARGPRVSVVLPVQDVADTIAQRIRAVIAEAERARVNLGEIITVDDYSGDLTWATLQALAWAEPRLRPMRLRKRFGVSSAREAGALAATGDVVITLEADAPADCIGQLAALVATGFDVVTGYRPGVRRPLLPLLKRLSGLRLTDPLSGTAAYRRDVLGALSGQGTALAHAPFAAHRKGYRVGEMPLAAAPAPSRDVRAVMGLLGAMRGIYGSERLLGLATLTGLSLVAAAVAVPVVVMLGYAGFGALAPIWLLTLTSGVLFLAGLQVTGMALLGGLMLAQTSRRAEVNGRIAETQLRRGAPE